MKLIFCIIATLLLNFEAYSSELISPRTDSLIQVGIKLGIQQSFDEASHLFEGLQVELPDNPVGYFFHAAVLQLRMMDSEIYDYEKPFLALIEKSIQLSDDYLRRNKKDAWGYFFLGSAYGYLAFYQAKQNEYLESLQNGRLSVKALETALSLDGALCDTYLAIGNYKYYRSKLSRHLAWLPFVDDDREAAIDMLRTAIEKGRYSKYSAMNSFCWIALEEGKFEEGSQMAERALNEFPESRVFLWAAAKLATKRGRLRKAAGLYERILRSLNDAGKFSAYNELICRKNLFHIYQELGSQALAELQCRRIVEIQKVHREDNRSANILHEMQELCAKLRESLHVGPDEQ